MTFGEKIREARITLKLTQKQLADKRDEINTKYSDICKRLAKESNSIVVAIDYFNSTIK